MRTPQNQHGAVLVELALLLVPLLILGFGVTELGRAVYQYNAIAKAVRDGSRHMSQFAPGDAVRIKEAQFLVTCGWTDCATRPPLVPGLKPELVRVRDRMSDSTYNLQATGRGAVNLVSVEVTGFVFRSVAPAFVPDIPFDTIRVTMVQVL